MVYGSDMLEKGSHLALVSATDDAPATDGRPLAELDDEDLMLLATSGLHPAFAVLVERYQALVLGSSARYLADLQLAREVTQEVFVALWVERERYQPRGKFRSYLLARTFNRCHVAARTRRNARRKLDTLAVREATSAGPEGPIEGLLRDARARALRAQLATLPEAMRRALVLRYFDDLSLEEVERILIRKALDRYAGNVSQAAAALGLSRSALYRRLDRHGL